MEPSTLVAALATLWLALGIAHFGRRHAGYSHVRHTLSELGQTGAPDAGPVALGVFLPFGVAMAAVGWIGRASDPQAAGLAACLAVGYLGAAAFPCDPGSPLVGSWRQALHNIAGAVQYVGGAAAIWRLATGGSCFAPLAAVVAVAAVLLSVPAVHRWRGAIQRVAEAALLAALMLALGAPDGA